MVRGTRPSIIASVAVVALTLAACGSSADDRASGDQSAAGTISIVASTNVYGDIVKRIGGDRVSVTSIISDPSQDPHSYEASTRTKLAVSRADIVIENGGGYDDFVTTLARGTDAKVLDVVSISGKKAPAGGELNEHVWYDFPTVAKLADQLVTALSAKDPTGKATFEKNATAFQATLKTLEDTEASIKAQYHGDGVAITEPVPLYLLQACGLVNKTPAEFSEAVEEGEDVPVSVLNATLDLFKDRRVKLLAYNEQTSGPETEKVLAEAKANGVAVVPVTETLPAGKNYVSWMTGNLAAVKAALAS